MAAILYSISIVAQYKGGNNDGFSLATVSNQNAIPNIYTGGINDGFSLATVSSQNAIPNIYTGGINDGFSLATVSSQNALPGIYTGGINDGFSLATVSSQNALPGIYTGGINDGFSTIVVTAQNPLANIYTGGSNDGFDQITSLAQNSLPDIYTGGGNDGWATFVIANQNQSVVLPVRLLEFNGIWQGDDVLVSWKTATETANDHFEVERSIDNGVSFQKIGVVNGHGTSNTINAYSFLDTDVKNQSGTIFYYRLKPVGIDGRFGYSAIVKLSRKEKQVSYVLFPNPGNGHFTVQVKRVNNLNGYSYQVYTEKGESLQNGLLQNTTTNFDLSGLPSGSYWIRIIKDGKPETTIKIILIK
jgi:hypothetical protein